MSSARRFTNGSAWLNNHGRPNQTNPSTYCAACWRCGSGSPHWGSAGRGVGGMPSVTHRFILRVVQVRALLRRPFGVAEIMSRQMVGRPDFAVSMLKRNE